LMQKDMNDLATIKFKDAKLALSKFNPTVGASKRGFKGYQATHEITVGGNYGPPYDLTVLKKGEKYYAAFGAKVVSDEFNSPEDAANFMLKMYNWMRKDTNPAGYLKDRVTFVKETFELDEAKSDYEIYHKDFSTAVQHAIKTAEKRGYKVDDDDWDRKVAMDPRKPSEGKTNSYSITLMDKNGKPVKKALQMQVYNKGGQNPYELNMYIEDFDVNAIFSEAMKKEKEATAKDKNKSVKSGDKLSGKQEPVEIQPELKEEK